MQAKSPQMNLEIGVWTFRSRLRRAAALLVCVLVVERAEAVAPDRALTQCLHRIWQVQQGLPQATIYAIHQSRDGYLWLGTQTGLVRFDGVRFTSIDEVGGIELKNIWVTDLAEDSDGGLWIATNGEGVIHIRSGVVARYRGREG